MKNIIRLIDLHSEDEGTLIDMEYTDDEGIKLVDLRTHVISKGTVGQLIEVDPLIKIAFASYLIKFLEHNK